MTTARLTAALALLLPALAWAADDKKPAGPAGFPQATFTPTHAPAGSTANFKLEKGKYTVTMNDMVIVEGSYKLDKDEITFTDEKGPKAGQGDEKTGSYKWKFEGGKLTFTKVKDANGGRDQALTGGVWTKAGAK
jgi:hypothetical protein